MSPEHINAVCAEIGDIIDTHYDIQADYAAAERRRIIALRECGYSSRHVHSLDCPYVTKDWRVYQ